MQLFGSRTRPSDLASRMTLITSNEKMNDIMNINKSLEESGLLMKGVSQKIKNEAKEQNGGFVRVLLSTLGAILLGNLLTRKGSFACCQGREANMPGQDTI